MSDVDSLLAELAHRDVSVWVDAGSLRFRGPSRAVTSEMRQRLVEHRDALVSRLASADSEAKTFESDARKERLPLSDLQRAYWLAESGGNRGTAGYWYEEYEARDLDCERLQSAWRQLIARHDALRVLFHSDGSQEVTASPPFVLVEQELRGLEEAEVAERLANVRALWGAPRGSLSAWPLIDMMVQRLPGVWRVHVAGRLAVLDGYAWDQLCEELALLYADPTAALPPLQQTYAGAVLEEAERKESQKYRDDLAWWMARGLPEPPELPYRSGFDEEAPRRFTRLRGQVPREVADALRERCARQKLTLNSVLCAAYAEVVGFWSQRSHFTLNVLLTNPGHLRGGGRWPLSNAASTLLLEILSGGDLVTSAGRVQARLAEDLRHASVSGIMVAREAARRAGRPAAANPVVFASALGMSHDDTERRYGMERLGWRTVHGYMQTPHVLLDQQVFEHEGTISFNWDYVPSAFCPGVVDAMFAAYRDLLLRLAASDEAWKACPAVTLSVSQLAVRARVNDTACATPPARLEGFMWAQAPLDRTALVDATGTWTYLDILAHAAGVASALRDWGVPAGQPVPVIAGKSRYQVAAALGVLLNDCPYVPLEPDAPPRRLASVLHALAPSVVLVDGDRAPRSFEGLQCRVIELGGVAPEHALPSPAVGRSFVDLAYIIFTSGSTGTPKGVEITHRAAWNTIADMLRRWPIRPEDALLGLSQFSFDLSVFDVFGAFWSGAKLVLPSEGQRREPACWYDLIVREGVTVWNTVPALMEMMVDYVESRGLSLPLRLVLLSGDWVPKDLPGRVRAVAPQAKVIALGGATEASIWSNYHDTELTAEAWHTVPYGQPLANQTMHVLNEQLAEVPDYCEGDLYLGGEGLACGYRGDPVRTAAAFVQKGPNTERLYRTGDRARRWPDGTIEFLGRQDAQVKVRGHRIELGEIEVALSAFPGVASAVAVVATRDGDRGVLRSLAAFLICDFEPAARREELQHWLRDRLPEYMIPSLFAAISELPLTPNGKVDRRALEQLALEKVTAPRKDKTGVETPLERTIQQVWTKVLGNAEIGRHDNFFEVGGDSVALLRVATALERATGIHLAATSIMHAPTPAELARVLEHATPRLADEALIHRFSKADPDWLICCIHPIGGTVLGYRELATTFAPLGEVIGISARGAITGQLDESVDEMANRYAGLIDRLYAGRRLILVGWSFGGVVSLELAARLARRGRKASVIAVDPWVRRAPGIELGEAQLRREFLASVGDSTGCPMSRAADLEGEQTARLFRVFAANARALVAHSPPPLAEVDCDLLVAGQELSERFDALQPIQRSTEWAVSFPTTVLDADHYTIVQRPAAEHIAALVAARVRGRA